MADPKEAPALLEPDAMIEQLRAMRARIPDYGQLPLSERRALVAGKLVTDPFIQAAINSIGASAIVGQAVGVSPEAMRREMAVVAQWTAVEDELRALLLGVVTANAVRRHRVAISGLQAYSIGQQLVRKEEHSDLLPHVAEMRRHNRLGRRRKAVTETPAPEPVPAPAPTP